MLPTLAHSSMAQRHQCTHGQHKRFPIRLFIVLVDEGADARIFIVVHEVSWDCQIVIGLAPWTSYTRSSCTLCRPEGSDLYSTLSLSSTTSTLSDISMLDQETYTLAWNAPMLLCTCWCFSSDSRTVAASYPALTSNEMRKMAQMDGSSSPWPPARSRCKEWSRRRLAVDMLAQTFG